MMPNPSDLLQRAAELEDRANHEETAEVRNSLLRMAEHYLRIARNEEWKTAHPISIESVTRLLNKSE
jgi:hypothetical protein